MKTNYLPRNKPRDRIPKRVLIILAVFVLGLIFFSTFADFLIQAVSPLWRVENIVSQNTRSFASAVVSKKALVAENENLKERLVSTEIERAALAAEREKVAELMELLGRRPEERGLAAAVLVHPPQTPYDTLVIDLGSAGGARVGAKVSLPEGPAIGEVTEVWERVSRVRLYSSAGVETSAILERGDLPVALKGLGAGNFKFDLPREAAVERGDRIITPALDSRLLALVEETRSSPTDSFKEVRAKTLANVFALRFVFVSP